jgi:hypothetical protein
VALRVGGGESGGDQVEVERVSEHPASAQIQTATIHRFQPVARPLAPASIGWLHAEKYRSLRGTLTASIPDKSVAEVRITPKSSSLPRRFQ